MESELLITDEDLKKEILASGASSFSDDVSANGQIMAIGDYLSDSQAVYLFEKEGPSWKAFSAITPDPSKELIKFGIDLHFSHDGMFLAVMAESGINFKGKTISSPVSIYKKMQNGYYSRMSFLYPKFEEIGSNYGSAMFLSADGLTLFVSADEKKNDHTTRCEGSTGGVYVYAWDESKRRHTQRFMMRPPHPGVVHFGFDLEFKDGILYVGEEDESKVYLYHQPDKAKDYWDVMP